MVKKSSVAIIPARGGSKRIPKKNIVQFGGKPLIAHTIKAAQESGCFDEIVVSTDSTEIQEIAVQHGAKVPFLRDAHADGIASSSQATHYCLQQLKTHGVTFEYVTQLMPNCPLRTGEDIVHAFEHFRSHSADAQISCSSFPWINPWWSATLDEAGKPHYLFPERISLPSQELPQLVAPTGAIWIAKVEHFMKVGSFYSDKTIFFEIPLMHAVDIDVPEDLALAQILYSYETKH